VDEGTEQAVEAIEEKPQQARRKQMVVSICK